MGIIIVSVALWALICFWIYEAKVKPHMPGHRPPPTVQRSDIKVTRWVNESGEVIEFAEPRSFDELLTDDDRRRRAVVASITP